MKRAYYLCEACHKGHFPLDDELGLRPNALSAELSRLAAMTGVQLPFGKGRDLFEELTLVSVSDQAMAKATQRVGDIVAEKKVCSRKQLEMKRIFYKENEKGGVQFDYMESWMPPKFIYEMTLNIVGVT